jgi:drug/metabolite transporter (DMT)-like permease
MQLTRLPLTAANQIISRRPFTATATNNASSYSSIPYKTSRNSLLILSRRRTPVSSTSRLAATTAAVTAAEDDDDVNETKSTPTSPSCLPKTTTVTTPRPFNVALLLFAVSAVMITGVCNRLLYKMALKPLGSYVFFLAQLQTFGYCFVYLLFLALRYRAGLVSNEMLQVPRKLAGTFVAIGFVEAVSSLLSFISAANLPGVVLPLLGQTVLFWQVFLAIFILKKRLGWSQIWGVTLVVSGVALAAWPSTATAAAPSILANINPMYAIIFVVSMLFPALDTILKESVFRKWREQLSDGSGRDLDLFILNSFGSLAQAGFVFMLLPAITAARGMAVADLPSYLAAGWQCVRGISPPCGSDCTGAPLIPILYVVFNLAFNVAALQVIKQAGNVAISLIMSAIVPLTLFAFTLPLPYLDPAPPLGPNFLLGAAVLMVGLSAYNAPMWAPTFKKYLAGLKEKSRTDWKVV